jgi:hypothetical protein
LQYGEQYRVARAGEKGYGNDVAGKQHAARQRQHVAQPYGKICRERYKADARYAHERGYYIENIRFAAGYYPKQKRYYDAVYGSQKCVFAGGGGLYSGCLERKGEEKENAYHRAGYYIALSISLNFLWNTAPSI